MAAEYLGMPYPTYLEYEQGYRGHNMSAVLYRHLMDKTSDEIKDESRPKKAAMSLPELAKHLTALAKRQSKK